MWQATISKKTTVTVCNIFAFFSDTDFGPDLSLTLCDCFLQSLSRSRYSLSLIFQLWMRPYRVQFRLFHVNTAGGEMIQGCCGWFLRLEIKSWQHPQIPERPITLAKQSKTSRFAKRAGDTAVNFMGHMWHKTKLRFRVLMSATAFLNHLINKGSGIRNSSICEITSYNTIEIKLHTTYNQHQRPLDSVSGSHYLSCHSRKLLTKKGSAGTFRYWSELDLWLLGQCHNIFVVSMIRYYVLVFYIISDSTYFWA